MLVAARAAGVEPVIAEGDGAFYAPKLDFVIKDAIGREWTCGTIQLDYVLPERLDAEYVGEDGGKHRPVMLHRAILGSLERFIGVLIENYAGAFPMWLAPVQVVVASISEGAHAYAEQAAEELRAAGLRVAVDTRGEKINYKIREHSLQKVPVIAVVGAKEAEERKLALRRFGSPGQRGRAAGRCEDIPRRGSAAAGSQAEDGWMSTPGAQDGDSVPVRQQCAISDAWVA